MAGFYSKSLRDAEFHEGDNFPRHKCRRRDDEHGAEFDVAFIIFCRSHRIDALFELAQTNW